MRVLVTGSRRADYPVLPIADALQQVQGHPKEPAHTLVVGDCPTGVDHIAVQIARQHGWRIARYRATWHRDGKRGGPERNQRMVDSGADICLAFPDSLSRGTWDCIRRARDAGIPVRVFDRDGQYMEKT